MDMLSPICSKDLLAKISLYLEQIKKTSITPSSSLIVELRKNINDLILCMLFAKTREVLQKNAVLLLKNFCYLMHLSNVKSMDQLNISMLSGATLLQIMPESKPLLLFEQIYKKPFDADFQRVTLKFLKMHMIYCKHLEFSTISDKKIYRYACAVFLYIYSWFILYPVIIEKWDLYELETLSKLS